MSDIFQMMSDIRTKHTDAGKNIPHNLSRKSQYFDYQKSIGRLSQVDTSTRLSRYFDFFVTLRSCKKQTE